MTKLPSRLRRLDDALLDMDDDAMLLSEVDGFLTGLAVIPEAVPPAEWLPVVWGGDRPPFDDPLDMRAVTDMVLARHAEIVRDLARGKPQPVFDVDERNGDLLWELWMEGFAAALELRPVDAGDDPAAAEALATMAMLAGVARNDSSLTSAEINDVHDAAPDLIPRQAALLYAWRTRRAGAVPPPAAPPSKIGRNDPCPCGSGTKHKRCCGAA